MGLLVQVSPSVRRLTLEQLEGKPRGLGKVGNEIPQAQRNAIFLDTKAGPDSNRKRTLIGMRLIAIVGFVGVTAAGSAHAQATSDSLPVGVTATMIEHGKTIFTGAGVCFACHGSDASGGTGPSLADTTWIHGNGSYEKIVSIITSGVPAKESKTGIIMPPRGGSAINDEDLRAVAAYVWSVSHSKH
jgi:mono/diheme cytochrome c family protein